MKTIFSRFAGTRKGFSITEIVVGLAVMSFLGLGISSIIQIMNQKSKQIVKVADLDIIRDRMLSVIQNDTAFRNTLNSAINSNAFSCFKNKALGCRGITSEFKVFDQNGSQFFASSLSTEPNIGFTLEGSQCASFSAAGSDQCPFKYVAHWEAVCNDTINAQGKTSIEIICRDPLLKISINFEFKPTNADKFGAYNKNKMNIQLVKSQNDSASNDFGISVVELFCQQVQGQFIRLDQACIINTALASTTCATGGSQFLVSGFDQARTPLCVTNYLTSQTVPMGQVLLSVNEMGEINTGGGVALSNQDKNLLPVVPDGSGGVVRTAEEQILVDQLKELDDLKLQKSDLLKNLIILRNDANAINESAKTELAQAVTNLSTAESNLSAAQSNLSAAQSSLSAAVAAQSALPATATADQKLAAQNAVSSASAYVDEAAMSVNSAQQAVGAAQQVVSQKTQVQNTAQGNYDYAAEKVTKLELEISQLVIKIEEKKVEIANLLSVSSVQ